MFIDNFNRKFYCKYDVDIKFVSEFHEHNKYFLAGTGNGICRGGENCRVWHCMFSSVTLRVTCSSEWLTSLLFTFIWMVISNVKMRFCLVQLYYYEI